MKLTIDKSFRENLKSSKTAATSSSAVSLPPPRPSTPSQDYVRFAEELQKTCMSTPGNKFDDSGWASNSNSISSFSMLHDGIDKAEDHFFDVEISQHSSLSFDRVNFTESVFTLLSSEPENESSTLSSEADVLVSSLTTDDSVESLHDWSMADLPSSWQEALDGHLMSSAFDHLSDNDDDLISADINDVVSNASSEANVGADNLPEVNELLAFVGQ